MLTDQRHVKNTNRTLLFFSLPPACVYNDPISSGDSSVPFHHRLDELPPHEYAKQKKKKLLLLHCSFFFFPIAIWFNSVIDRIPRLSQKFSDENAKFGESGPYCNAYTYSPKLSFGDSGGIDSRDKSRLSDPLLPM